MEQIIINIENSNRIFIVVVVVVVVVERAFEQRESEREQQGELEDKQSEDFY